MSLRQSKLVQNSVSANPVQQVSIENLVRDYASFDFGEFTFYFRLFLHVMTSPELLLVSEDSTEMLLGKFYYFTKHFNLGFASMQLKEIDVHFSESLTEE